MNSRLHHRLRHHGHCAQAGPLESQPQPTRPQPITPEQPEFRSRFPSLDLPYPRNVPLPSQWRPSLPLAFIPSSRWSTHVEPRLNDSQQVALLCSEWSAYDEWQSHWTPVSFLQSAPSVEKAPLQQTHLEQNACRDSQSFPFIQQTEAPPKQLFLSDSQWRPSVEQSTLSNTQWSPSVEQVPFKPSLSDSQWHPSLEQNTLSNTQWRPSVEQVPFKHSLSDSQWHPSVEQSTLSNTQWSPSVEQVPFKHSLSDSQWHPSVEQNTLSNTQWRPSVEQVPFKHSLSDSQWQPSVEQNTLSNRQWRPLVEQTALRPCTRKDELPDALTLLEMPQNPMPMLQNPISLSERPPLLIFPPRQSKLRWADKPQDLSDLEGQRHPVSSAFSSSASSVSCKCSRSRDTSVDGYSDISRTDEKDMSGKYTPCPSCRFGDTCGSRLLQSTSVPCILERPSSECLQEVSSHLPAELLLERDRRAEPLALLAKIHSNPTEVISDPYGKGPPSAPAPPKTELKDAAPRTETQATGSKKRRLKRTSDCRHALHFIYVMLHASAIAIRVWDYTARSQQGERLPAATCQEKIAATTPSTTDTAQWFQRMRASLPPDDWVAVRIPDDQREEEFLRRLFLDKGDSHGRPETSAEIVKQRGRHRSKVDRINSHSSTGHPLHTSHRPNIRNPLWQDEEFVQRLNDHLKNFQRPSKRTKDEDPNMMVIEGSTTSFPELNIVRNNKSATLKTVDENMILVSEPRTVTQRQYRQEIRHQPHKLKKKVPQISKEKLTPMGSIPDKVISTSKQKSESYGNLLSKPKFYSKSLVPQDEVRSNGFPGGQNATLHTKKDLSEEKPPPKWNIAKKRDVIPESLVHEENSLNFQEATTEALEPKISFVEVFLDLLIFTQTGSASVFLLSLYAAMTGYVVGIVPFLIFNVLWCFCVAVFLLVYSVHYLSLAIILIFLAALQLCEISSISIRLMMGRLRKRASSQ